MTININDKYPGKTAGTTVDYPLGEPRSVSVPGADDGTPWSVDLLKDLLGPRQFALAQASVNANGDPDTGTASQYIQALRTLCTRAEATTVGALLLDMQTTRAFTTAAYVTPGDTGSVLWVATGTTVPTKSGTLDGGVFHDNAGREFIPVASEYTPRMYGAAGDGVADDTDAVFNARDITARLTSSSNLSLSLYLPQGVYRVAKPIPFSQNLALRGDGPDSSELVFDVSVPGDFSQGACLTNFGIALPAPDLSVDVVEGSFVLTFGSAHGFNEGDFGILRDGTVPVNTAESFYTQGEFFEVAEVLTTTTLAVRRPLASGYAEASADVAKVFDTSQGANIEGLTVRTNTATSAIRLVDADSSYGFSFRNCRFSGSAADGALRFRSCANIIFSDCDFTETRLGASTGREGLQLLSCQDVTLRNVRGQASGPVIHVGGHDGPNPTVSRYIRISGCELSTRDQSQPSVRIAGPVESWSISDSRLDGIDVGGALGGVSDCEIRSRDTSGIAVQMREAHGMDIVFDACKFLARKDIPGGRRLVELSNSESALQNDGPLQLRNCEFQMQGYAGDALVIEQRQAASRPSVVVKGCSFTGGELVSITPGLGGGPFDSIRVQGCSLEGAALQTSGAEDTDIVGCEVLNSPTHGIRVSGTSIVATGRARIRIDSCKVREAEFSGIYCGDLLMAPLETRVAVTNCESVSNNVAEALVNTNTSIRMRDIDDVLLARNTVGDDRDAATQNAFVHIRTYDTLYMLDTMVVGFLGQARDIVGPARNEWATHVQGSTVAEFSGNELLASEQVPLAAIHSVLAQLERHYVRNTVLLSAFNFALWDTVAPPTVKGSDGFVEVEATNNVAGAAVFEYTFEGGAYETVPMVVIQGGGSYTAAQEWRVISRTTTTVVIGHDNIPAGELAFVSIQVTGVRSP